MGWLDAVISAAGSWLSGRSASKDKDKERAAAAAQASAANAEEYKYTGRLARLNNALTDYYKLRDRQETRNAAAEYGKFSSLDRWAPGYTQTYKPLQAPAAPPTEDNIDTYHSGYTAGSNITPANSLDRTRPPGG